jgi:hypothetical protein
MGPLIRDVAVGIAVFFAVWWIESRVAVIVTELQAIRINLDRLWADNESRENPEISGPDA